MEEEQITPEVEPEVKESKWTHVTPLSKYLAMILFILMPFIGGWIGYHYAPEKVVEIEKISYQSDSVDWLLPSSIETEYKDPDLVSPLSSSGTQRTFSLDDLDLNVKIPSEYLLLKRTGEPNRRGSFLSYDFERTDYTESQFDEGAGYLSFNELQFFNEESISRCTDNEWVDCFMGDFPTLERFFGQKKAYSNGENYEQFKLVNFGDTPWFVSNHKCVGEFCVIREYTKFIEDIKVDVWIVMDSAEREHEADLLFAKFDISPKNTSN